MQLIEILLEKIRSSSWQTKKNFVWYSRIYLLRYSETEQKYNHWFFDTCLLDRCRTIDYCSVHDRYITADNYSWPLART